MLANRMLMSSKKTYDSFTKSLLHFNNSGGAIVDEIGKTWTAPSGYSSVAGKYGANCIQFSGTQWIETPDHADFTLGSGAFTFDFWVKVGALGVKQYLFGQGTSAANANYSVYGTIEAGGQVNFKVSDGTVGAGTATTATISDTTTWHHLAFVSTGPTIYVYIDGLQSSAVASLVVQDNANKFSIGRHGEFASNYFTGYIDEFRFSKGVARWTANFTPPTAEY